MARSRRWSGSEDIFSAQLSRVSIRYVLYLRALCLRLNAVWGAICIPLSLSLSLHIYLYLWDLWRVSLYIAAASENPTENRSTGCAMHSAIYASPAWLKWLTRHPPPHSSLPTFPSLSHSFPYGRTKHMRQYIKRGDWQEAQHQPQRQHQHQSTEALPSVGNNFN